MLKNKLGLNAPQFPGQQFGASVEQVRDYIKRQRRVKGYLFNVTAGQTQQNLTLSGTAKQLLGIQLIPIKAGADTYIQGFQQITEIGFKVNNEIIIETLHPNFLTNYSNDEEFCPIPRPLSGSDQITINFNNPGATETCGIAIYYI
jgi:hypothetical protein